MATLYGSLLPLLKKPEHIEMVLDNLGQLVHNLKEQNPDDPLWQQVWEIVEHAHIGVGMLLIETRRR